MKTIDLRAVNIADIRVAGRLRQTAPSTIEGFTASLSENGLQQPIEVMQIKDRLILVDGAHRLEAAKSLGWDQIDAVIKEPETDNPKAEARIHEIDGNLIRPDLVGLDRMLFLVARKAAYQELHPEARRGGDRRSKKARENQKPDLRLWSFSKETARKLGLGESTIKNAITIFNRLSGETRFRLRGHALAESDTVLTQLSELDDEMQKCVLDLLLADEPEFNTVADAINHLTGKKQPSPIEKIYQSAATSLNRLTPSRRADVFRSYQEEIKALAKKEDWF